MDLIRCIRLDRKTIGEINIELTKIVGRRELKATPYYCKQSTLKTTADYGKVLIPQRVHACNPLSFGLKAHVYLFIIKILLVPAKKIIKVIFKFSLKYEFICYYLAREIPRYSKFNISFLLSSNFNEGCPSPSFLKNEN